MSATEEAATAATSAETVASIGTAVLSVLLATELANQLGHTFWYATGLLGIALIGSLTLPKHRPQLAEGDLLR